MLDERFWSKVKRGRPDECWPWLGACRRGYGRFRYEGLQDSAHRVIFKETVGQIPEDRELDHLCGNKACCNPAHLEIVTRSENLLRRRVGFKVNATELTRLRLAAGYSQERLAWSSQVSTRTIQHLESGQQRALPRTLEQVANALGCHKDTLVDESEEVAA